MPAESSTAGSFGVELRGPWAYSAQNTCCWLLNSENETVLLPFSRSQLDAT